MWVTSGEVPQKRHVRGTGSMLEGLYAGQLSLEDAGRRIGFRTCVGTGHGGRGSCFLHFSSVFSTGLTNANGCTQRIEHYHYLHTITNITNMLINISYCFLVMLLSEGALICCGCVSAETWGCTCWDTLPRFFSWHRNRTCTWPGCLVPSKLHDAIGWASEGVKSLKASVADAHELEDLTDLMARNTKENVKV